MNFTIGTDVSLEYLKTIIPESKDVGVALVGSIAEGLANREADVDILVLGGSDEDHGLLLADGSFRQTVWHDPDGREINVETWSSDRLRKVATQHDSAIEGIRCLNRGRNVEFFRSFGDLRLLHRIGRCVPIHNEDVVARWQKVLRSSDFWIYATVLNLFEHYNFREDFIGEFESGNTRSASWLVIVMLTRLAGSLLTSHGETNIMLEKWLPRLLSQKRSDIGEEVVDEMLRHLSRDLSRPISASEVNEILEYSDRVVRSILDDDKVLARAVYFLVHAVRLKRHLSSEN